MERQRRLAEITTHFIRHDVAFLLDGLACAADAFATFKTDAGDQALSDPECVCRLAEALGPAFVNMSQILSMGAELVPVVYLIRAEAAPGSGQHRGVARGSEGRGDVAGDRGGRGLRHGVWLLRSR